MKKKIDFVPIKDTTCGLDVHKDMIEACVILNYGAEVVQKTFSTLRSALFELRDWLASLNCINVLMESTSVYWMPVYEVLEETPAMDVGVGNAQKMKNVPGRAKTDKEDSLWIAKLCMFGLLLKSFVVGRKFRDLREYTRYHKKLVQEKARHTARIEKLLQMNGFKLSTVMSDIVGYSGKRVLHALAEKGTVSLNEIRELVSSRLQSTPEEIESAINGKFKASSQTLLKKMLKKLATLENEIGEIADDMNQMAAPYAHEINLLDSIPGLDIIASTYLIAEISNDLSSFETSRRFTAWAGLAPKDNMSAGKLKSSKTKKANQYVKTLMIECAWAASRTRNTRIARWYWSHQGKLGRKKAITATARKLLITYVYAVLKTGKPYDISLDTANNNPTGHEQKPEMAVKKIGKCINNQLSAVTGANNDNNSTVSETSNLDIMTVNASSFDTDNDQDRVSVPRKRGRPKKTIEVNTDLKQNPGPPSKADCIVTAMPKRRGRPKKIPIVIHDAEDI